MYWALPWRAPSSAPTVETSWQRTVPKVGCGSWSRCLEAPARRVSTMCPGLECQPVSREQVEVRPCVRPVAGFDAEMGPEAKLAPHVEPLSPSGGEIHLPSARRQVACDPLAHNLSRHRARNRDGKPCSARPPRRECPLACTNGGQLGGRIVVRASDGFQCHVSRPDSPPDGPFGKDGNGGARELIGIGLATLVRRHDRSRRILLSRRDASYPHASGAIGNQCGAIQT